jgi:hypothetical protein
LKEACSYWTQDLVRYSSSGIRTWTKESIQYCWIS